ncbi:glycosyltransferase [Vibrio cionasavignyae]|uniref:glycosyltransferase n=1 Tax=Vibrio cionasavignyae TaxID=2910252 RepID=UPI003D0C8694
MKNILYVHFGENWIRGSEQCLIQLIDHLNTAEYHPVVWTNNHTLNDLLATHSIDSQLDNFTLLMGGYQPNFNVKNWFQLISKGIALIKQFDIDAIHVNSGAPCQWMNLVAKVTGTPLVTQLHSDYILRDRFWLGLHLSPRVVTVSHAISKNLLADGFPKDQLDVIHNGIPNTSASETAPEQYQELPSSWVKQELQLPDDTLLFATVGSLIHRKGVDRLLHALARLTPHYPNLHLVVIGDGELRQALQSLTMHLRIEKHVTFVGEQSNVSQWLIGGVDGFISAAREEAFGLVIAEAALAKLPIIAPNTGGIPEFVTHNTSALLFDNHGDDELLVQWCRLIDEFPSLSPALADHAYSYVSKHLSVETNTRAIEHIYDKVIKNQAQESVSLFAALRPLKTYIQRRWVGGVRHV